MSYFIFAGLIALVALALLYVVYHLLISSQWFMGWLRGMAGITLLVTAIFCAVIATDLSSYKTLTPEKIIGIISFKAIAEQRFAAILTDENGSDVRYELHGDQWQLNSRIIRWSSTAKRFGIASGYRLERLSGRYLLLDDNRVRSRTTYGLSTSIVGVDTWLWLNNIDNTLTFVDAQYGNTIIFPMSDGARYTIALGLTGLIIRPNNQAAKEAVILWQ